MDEISLKSEVQSFSISPTVAALGKITAVRVQDIMENKWFNYDEGKWDAEPVVTPGENNLYIAFWVVNEGETGDLTLNLKDVGGLLATKTFSVPAGEGLGVEWTGDMPSGSYAITLEVLPQDTMEFTIKSTEGFKLFGLAWWQIALIALAVVGGGGAVYYTSRRKKE